MFRSLSGTWDWQPIAEDMDLLSAIAAYKTNQGSTSNNSYCVCTRCTRCAREPVYLMLVLFFIPQG